MRLMADGSQFLEPELRRVHALVRADVAPPGSNEADTLLREAVASAVALRSPVLERRCLVSLDRFLRSSGRRDPAVESRLAELSHLADLGRRVARAMQTRLRA
jgi:hypothetical protein